MRASVLLNTCWKLACHLAGKTHRTPPLLQASSSVSLKFFSSFFHQSKDSTKSSSGFPFAGEPSNPLISNPASHKVATCMRNPTHFASFSASLTLRSSHHRNPNMRHISPGPPSPPARTGRGRANTWSFGKVRNGEFLISMSSRLRIVRNATDNLNFKPKKVPVVHFRVSKFFSFPMTLD